MNIQSSRPRVKPRAAQQKRTQTDPSTTVESLRQLMRDFVRERQWEKYHTPQNLAAAVSVEAAELLELFQWFTPEEARERRCASRACVRPSARKSPTCFCSSSRW